MPDDIRAPILSLLEQLSTRKLDALKQLFWAELNYDRANEPLSTRDWPRAAGQALAEPPTLFAMAGNDKTFHIIYGRLKSDQLRLDLERPVISRLLAAHPYALFIFSDSSQANWHFVNVRYEKSRGPAPAGEAENGVSSRRVFRRITVGPYERLRTAAERISLLDIATLSPDLLGLSPLVIQQRHDEAFDVEAVTRRFFSTYRQIFERTEESIRGIKDENRRVFTQRLFNRLLFIIFLERKGWLSFLDGARRRYDFLQALWEAHRKEKAAGETVNFYNDRLKLLFFSGLNTRNEVNIVGIQPNGFLQSRIGQVPYLNGGLFEEEGLDRSDAVRVPDEALAPALGELLYHFNFTVTESTPLDIEVAVDPEMLGKIFEELVTGRHESGSYYTPKPVVAFMGQEALKGYLARSCPGEAGEAIAAFVEERDATGLGNPERVLEALRTVRICDPACGSGAYLLGMLHELLDLRAALFAARRLDPLTAYQRKLEIIQHNLYGVDLDPFAVNIARLRLWLSLIVEFEGDTPPPLPNLDFKIEAGDSLTAPDPSGGLQPDMFRQQQVAEYFRQKGRYLDTHGPEKLALREEIERLRADIAAWAHPRGGGGGFDWAVEFAEVFAGPALAAVTLGEETQRESGFDIVLANPPYVRADAQFRHLSDEEERQAAIAEWQQYRQDLKRSKIYDTLYEKWDLYIPFLERAYQLLRPRGQMVFIIPDAYNIAKYAGKSHKFFLERSKILRLDFCSDIPLFEAGVQNTILHFARTVPDENHTSLRFRRWGDKPDDFETNIEPLSSEPQLQSGSDLFRPNTKQSVKKVSGTFIPLEKICYISKGMVIHADERKAHLAFKTEDLISLTKDGQHPKPYVEGKDLVKWGVQRVRFLEYGTERAPALFSRPTFPELYEVPEKLISMDLSGDEPAVVYDAKQLYHNHSAWSFVPWHYLEKVVNRSIDKKARYRWQLAAGDREEREEVSKQFHVKYLLAVMNSSFASEWLKPHRRSKRRFYPDDWKQLPVVSISKEEQQELVRLVDKILAEFDRHRYPLPDEAVALVAKLEAEMNERVARLYGI